MAKYLFYKDNIYEVINETKDTVSSMSESGLIETKKEKWNLYDKLEKMVHITVVYINTEGTNRYNPHLEYGCSGGATRLYKLRGIKMYGLIVTSEDMLKVVAQADEKAKLVLTKIDFDEEQKIFADIARRSARRNGRLCDETGKCDKYWFIPDWWGKE